MSEVLICWTIPLKNISSFRTVHTECYCVVFSGDISGLNPSVKHRRRKLLPGGSMKFICIGRWRRDCQVILFSALIEEHTILHTGDIPELGSLANRRQTFTQAFQSRDTHSDNMLIVKGFFSVQNNRKQTCLRQTFTSNNERVDLTSVTIRTWAVDAVSHRVISKSSVQLWVSGHGLYKESPALVQTVQQYNTHAD